MIQTAEPLKRPYRRSLQSSGSMNQPRKNESPEVNLEFDRLAELGRIEHDLKYPNYNQQHRLPKSPRRASKTSTTVKRSASNTASTSGVGSNSKFPPIPHPEASELPTSSLTTCDDYSWSFMGHTTVSPVNISCTDASSSSSSPATPSSPPWNYYHSSTTFSRSYQWSPPSSWDTSLEPSPSASEVSCYSWDE